MLQLICTKHAKQYARALSIGNLSQLIYIYIYIFFFFVLIFLKIGGLCLSFLLDWFGVQREEFLLRHEEESEQIKNMEKKSFGDREQYMPFVFK